MAPATAGGRRESGSSARAATIVSSAARRWRCPQAQRTHPHGNGHTKTGEQRGNREWGKGEWRDGQQLRSGLPATQARPHRRAAKTTPLARGKPKPRPGVCCSEGDNKPKPPPRWASQLSAVRQETRCGRQGGGRRRAVPWHGPASPRGTSTTLKTQSGENSRLALGRTPCTPQNYTMSPPPTPDETAATGHTRRGEREKCRFSRWRRRRDGQAPQHRFPGDMSTCGRVEGRERGRGGAPRRMEGCLPDWRLRPPYMAPDEGVRPRPAHRWQSMWLTHKNTTDAPSVRAWPMTLRVRGPWNKIFLGRKTCVRYLARSPFSPERTRSGEGPSGRKDVCKRCRFCKPTNYTSLQCNYSFSVFIRVKFLPAVSRGRETWHVCARQACRVTPEIRSVWRSGLAPRLPPIAEWEKRAPLPAIADRPEAERRTTLKAG